LRMACICSKHTTLNRVGIYYWLYYQSAYGFSSLRQFSYGQK
jgi:hypothetical protein